MEILRGFDERATSPSVVTIGSFATIHRGHKAVIDRVRDLAAGAGAAAGLVTFEPHPLEILRPAAAPCKLNTLKQRLRLFEDAGIQRVLIIDFNPDVASMEAETFVQQALVESMNVSAAVVGPDFRFGRARAGDAETIRSGGVETHVIDLVSGSSAEKISTTQIRGLIGSGEVTRAAELLGRPHRIAGKVVHGDGAGTGFGFPTANVAPHPNSCMPAPGIYAGRWIADDEARNGVVYVGDRSTVSDAGRIGLEIHIFDFSGDLYGAEGEVEFVQKIRGDRRFDSTTDLIAQMHQDATQASEVLARFA